MRVLLLAVSLAFAALPAGAQSIRINCGGWSQPYQTADGKNWNTDRYFTGGQVTYEPDVRTKDTRLYGTGRSGLYTEFQYRIPVANGKWKLTLKFAELHTVAVGTRVFHVNVNGQPFLANFDISAEAPFPLVLDKTTTVDVTDGFVSIEFKRVKGHGIVSGIELEPVSDAATPPVVSPSTSSATAGERIQFSATGAAAITWTVSGSASSLGTISSTGEYVAPASIPAPAVVTVKAASTANPTQTGTATVNLRTTSVTVSPATSELVSGNSQQFTAAVTGTADARVTWAASLGTISPAGLYTSPPVTSATNVIVTATSVADSSVSATAQLRVVPVAPSSGAVFVEQDGLVSMEAESASTIARPPHAWILRTGPGASGGNYLSAEPDSGIYHDTEVSRAPEAIFAVRFTQTGTYQVWLRGKAPSVASDSVNVGLDGALVFTGQRLSNFVAGDWTWSHLAMDGAYPITINIATAGLHTIHLWMREDGFAVDKIVLTKSTSFEPADLGPAQSTMESTSTPALSLSPSSLSLALTGQEATASQTISIRNSGIGSLSWTASSNQNWLTVSATGGTAPANLTVTATRGSLAAGTHQALITITASGAQGSPQQIGVSFTVPTPPTAPPAPALTVTPTALSFTTPAGASPAPQQLTVGNTGGGTLSWSATSNQPWVILGPSSGQAPGTVNVSVAGTSLAPGTYQASVTLTASGATGSPRTVPVTLIVTSLPGGGTGSGRQFYVSPAGNSAGDGSVNRPWDLATALLPHSSIRPGDTIWLRNGRYGNGRTQFVSRLAGTASQPILVRQYPGERATIDGGLGIYGPYTWYWGFEIMSSVADRSATRGVPDGADTYEGSTGVKLINLVIHDTDQGIGFWRFGIDAEVHGCLIYYNGYRGPTRGHGHGIYTQNETGTKLITDNILFNGFALGIQAYGSGAAGLRNYLMQGNVSFNNGSLYGNDKVDNILITVGSGARNIRLENNYTYHTPSTDDGYSRLGWQWSGTEYDIVARDNYFIGGEAAMEFWKWTDAIFTGNVLYSNSKFNLIMNSSRTAAYHWNGNTYYGAGLFRFNNSNLDWAGWKAATKLDAQSTYTPGAPRGTWSFVRPNKFEQGRANVVIYNWGRLPSVAVPAVGVLAPGDSYVVRDAQNWFGNPVASGVYNGQSISIPMAGLTVAAPVGVPAPPHTAPEFGAFVILKQ
ncbi:MAG: hypothetical protein JNK87_26485 [Bryobacterales bacterium]|nr:hypothetical protein [Bryobacterales bacterium]